MPKCEKVFVIMKWILQWKGGWHAPAVVINQHDISNRWHVTTRWSLATWPEVAAYNFLFAGKECVALEALRPVDGDEGEHVGEGGVCRAVGDPGQCHGSWLVIDPDTHQPCSHTVSAYIKFSHIKTKKPKAPIKVIFSVPYKGETSSIILFFLPVDWKVEQSFPSFQVRHLYSSDGYQHGHADQPPVVLPSLKIFGIKENIYSHST